MIGTSIHRVRGLARTLGQLGIAGLLLSGVGLVVVTTPQPAAAQEEVQNDSYDGNSEIFLQAGQAIGDTLAVRLTPTTPCPCRVTDIKWVLNTHPLLNPTGIPPGLGRFFLRIWDDPGGSADPGTLLLDVGVEQLSSPDHFILTDLTTETVIVNGPFRVGFEMVGPDDFLNPVFLASEGTTGGGTIPPVITPLQNMVYDVNTSSWDYAENFGVSGDFIIRAIVEPAGPVSVPLVPWIVGPTLTVTLGGAAAWRLGRARRDT